ncbi:MAG: 4-hydroxythreonine-4-phosphate dehydrogenase PdxA [Planctomycetia bacterium]
MATDQRPLAVSMGEPAGIGPDLIAHAAAHRAALGLPAFVAYGDPALFAARARRLGLAVEVAAGTPDDAASAAPGRLMVVPTGGPVADRPGDAVPGTAPVVIEAIRRAVADTLAGRTAGIVTAPIHKGLLYGAGFGFPGHTEFLATLAAQGGAVPRAVMMLADGDLRAVPATVHVPLRAVPELLTADLLVETGRIVAGDLVRRFGIAAPKIAFTGLNPHAGEGGAIGREEIEIIAPAVRRLEAEGIAATGPLSADTLFHPPSWRRFDAVIAMYHDQALIPIKTVAFDRAVNVTLGLPFVRTSPDHGTAFDLAGTGRASPESFVAALRLAARLALKRSA